jgi:hypothetical protein
MAEQRGGFRPTAPQNNPANINPMGGDGQSGRQPARYIPGMRSQGVTSQEVYNMQTEAPLAGAPTPPQAPAFRSLFEGMPVTSLNEPTRFPDRPISYGSTFDPSTPGPEVVPMPPIANPTMDSGVAALQAMYLRDPNNEDLRRVLETLSAEGRLP